MAESNTRYPEPQSDAGAAGGLGVFQFSLWSLFVVVTAVALILSTYFGVGQLAGMSTADVLTLGLGRLLFTVPTLLVWIFGLTVAIRRLRRNRLPAILTMIALGGLVLTSFALQLVQMVLFHLANFGQIAPESFSWIYTFIGILYAMLNAACWILVLTAIFVRRPPDASGIERSGPSGATQGEWLGRRDDDTNSPQ